MIPKIIHYCWLSDDPLPSKLQNCVDSWKRNLPDYEIKKWDFSVFDINSSVWVREAFESKKYAFAADYIRCYALYKEGGIYLDSDVEVLKSFNDLLSLPYFIGKENEGRIEAAVMGAMKGNKLFMEMLSYYEGRHFKNDEEYDIRPLPSIIEEKVEKLYHPTYISTPAEILKDNKRFYILPFDYFSPKSHKSGKIKITANTYCIHHFSGSWMTGWSKYRLLLTRIFGSNNMKRMSKLKQFLKGIIR